MSDAWRSYLLTVLIRAICCAIGGFFLAIFLWLRTNRYDREVDFLWFALIGPIAGALFGAGTVPRHELPWVEILPHRSHHCPRCGYDLRGNPGSTGEKRALGCPECGWNRDKLRSPPPAPPTGPYDVDDD